MWFTFQGRTLEQPSFKASQLYGAASDTKCGELNGNVTCHYDLLLHRRRGLVGYIEVLGFLEPAPRRGSTLGDPSVVLVKGSEEERVAVGGQMEVPGIRLGRGSFGEEPDVPGHVISYMLQAFNKIMAGLPGNFVDFHEACHKAVG